MLEDKAKAELRYAAVYGAVVAAEVLACNREGKAVSNEDMKRFVARGHSVAEWAARLEAEPELNRRFGVPEER